MRYKTEKHPNTCFNNLSGTLLHTSVCGALHQETTTTIHRSSSWGMGHQSQSPQHHQCEAHKSQVPTQGDRLDIARES